MNNHYRNKRLLEMIHELPCQLELDGCLIKPAVPCHSNEYTHGKGCGIKAHDCFVAAGCTVAVGASGCHYAIDSGMHMTREERQSRWRLAWHQTFVMLYGLAWIELPTVEMLVPNCTTRGWHRVYPGGVTDDEWLDLWRTGRARVK